MVTNSTFLGNHTEPLGMAATPTTAQCYSFKSKSTSHDSIKESTGEGDLTRHPAAKTLQVTPPRWRFFRSIEAQPFVEENVLPFFKLFEPNVCHVGHQWQHRTDVAPVEPGWPPTHAPLTRGKRRENIKCDRLAFLIGIDK